MSNTTTPLRPVGLEAPASRAWVPPLPQTVEETGLSEEFITDLILKTLYVQGARLGQEIVDTVRLPFPFVDEQLLALQHRRFVEVRSTHGPSRAGYVFDLTTAGRERAREATEANQYVGPAPVPLNQYRRWCEVQSIRHARVTRREVEAGFNWLVLDHEVLDQIGPAINSARSLFLYGDPGNGKTASAETIARLLGGAIYIPYALEVDGQVVVTYDPLFHRPVQPNDPPDGLEEELFGRGGVHDGRYIQIHRPVVLVGGELTLEQLDLQYDQFTKMYQAPFQVKANGGVLIVDDFGRQRMPPRELLNRWIVPLEKRVDFLTLHTGVKFPVPFDCLLIMATNIRPSELIEEAFLRRIHYKIKVESPTPDQYEAIFRRCCEERGLTFDLEAVHLLYREFYEHHTIAPRGCHPRDVLDHLTDIAKYLEREPTLSPDLLRRAGRSYFLDFVTAG
jgi:predicted ATPase with chaperone activity